MPKQLLLLFDIDGTLLHTEGRSRRALQEAFRKVCQVEIDLNAYELAGRTDLRIFSDIVAMHELITDKSIDPRRRLFPAYVEALQGMVEREGVTVLPGVEALLASLKNYSPFHVALLTGNHRESARVKITAAGLQDYFSPMTGAFGDHHKEREPLLHEAIIDCSSRIGYQFSSNETVVIGDAPADISCARNGSAHIIAVCTGYVPPTRLAAMKPDLLLTDLTDQHAFFGFLNQLLNEKRQRMKL